MRKYEKALNDIVSLVNEMAKDGTDYGTCFFSLSDRISGITSVAVYDDSISKDAYYKIQAMAAKIMCEWVTENKNKED